MSDATRRPQDAVVLAIGNPILSDDGAGIAALRRLAGDARLPASVRLVDGGTDGPDVLARLEGCRRLLVLDAIDVGGAPGDVVRLDLLAPLPLARPLGVHELGVTALLGDLRLLGDEPEQAILLGIQPACLSPGTALSPEVERGLEALVGEAVRQLREWTRTDGG